MIRILGPLEVEFDGRVCTIPGPRQRALLIELLLHANEVVSTDRLVHELWGGDPPRTATTSLHNAISQLRRELGDAVVTHPPGYLLRIARSEVDAFRFEDLLDEARRQEPALRAELLREGLALWRGEALLDVAYETFASSAAARLEELRAVAEEELIDAELALGHHESLVPRLEALVAQSPLRERLWGQLMLALYRAGRQADASHAYQRARRALVEELGIEPGPALKQLHGAIIRQEPELAVASVPALASADGADLADVVTALLGGRVVPVLGEDADALTARLVDRFHYPAGEPAGIERVSQFAAATRGYGPLHDEVRDWVLEADEPNAVHRFFASLAPVLRERGVPHELLVTTSYGHALERAFQEAGEEIDVVSYIAFGRDRGKFVHIGPDGSTVVVEAPNVYAGELSLERRTIVLRLRGGVDPSGVVVTEDDYIDYLRRADVSATVPVGVAATLRRSHYLFLGYTVRDWALRLVLGRMWGDEPVAYRSWAVQPKPGPAERELWRRLDVDLAETELETYVGALADAVGLPLGAAT